MIGMSIARTGTVREPMMDDGAWTGETATAIACTGEECVNQPNGS